MAPPTNTRLEPGIRVSISPIMPPVHDSAVATVASAAISRRATRSISVSSPVP
jgi:hypothetical protein